MGETETPIEIQVAALTNDIQNKLSKFKESKTISEFFSLGIEYKKYLEILGYTDDLADTDPDNPKQMRNYYSFHRLIASTPKTPESSAFLDFPGEASALIFLDKKLQEHNDSN